MTKILTYLKKNGFEFIGENDFYNIYVPDSIVALLYQDKNKLIKDISIMMVNLHNRNYSLKVEFTKNYLKDKLYPNLINKIANYMVLQNILDIRDNLTIKRLLLIYREKYYILGDIIISQASSANIHLRGNAICNDGSKDDITIEERVDYNDLFPFNEKSFQFGKLIKRGYKICIQYNGLIISGEYFSLHEI